MSEGLVAIAHEFSPLKADLIRSRLESDGVECFVEGSSLASVVGSFSYASGRWKHPTTNLAIKVRSSDESRAREILREMEAEPEEKFRPESPLGGVLVFLLKAGAATVIAVAAGVVAERYYGMGQLVAAIILLGFVALILKNLFKAE